MMKTILQKTILVAPFIVAVHLNFQSVAQWTDMSVSPFIEIGSVHMMDEEKIFISGGDGFLQVSENGGESWTDVDHPADEDLADIFFLDENTGWISGGDGQVIKTTDGGINWDLQFTPASEDLEGIFFTDDNNGFAVGREGTIIHTSDGGDNWTMQNSGSSARLESVWFIDANTGFVTGRDGAFLTTSDAGNSWTTGNIAAGGDDLKDILFTDDNTGYICGDEGMFFISTDSGNSWDPVDTDTDVGLSALTITGSTIYVAGEEGIILVSNDGGSSWSEIETTSFIEFEDIHFINENNGFCVGEGGTILKYEDESIGLDEYTEDMISIFPNPTSNLLNIHLSEDIKNYKLSVNDANGRNIQQELKFAVSTTMDISQLPAGIYFISITDQNNNKQYTKKLVKR